MNEWLSLVVVLCLFLLGIAYFASNVVLFVRDCVPAKYKFWQWIKKQ